MEKVSVIIPAFNCATTVRETVLSVVEGNKDAIAEVIIVDDKSTDQTRSILQKLQNDFDSVNIFYHNQNYGGAVARNTAVEKCSSKYVFCLDSDNVLVPGSLSSLVAFAEENDADVAAFRELHYFMDSKKRTTHLWRFPPGHFTFADYVAGTVVPGASGNYLFKKSAWADVGGYRKGSGALDSWVFGLDLVANNKKMFVANEGYYLHRYGMPSYWVRESKNQKAGLLATQLIENYLDQMEEESCHRVRNSDGDWFELINQQPLKLVGIDVGRAGVAIDKSASRRFRQAINGILSKLARRY